MKTDGRNDLLKIIAIVTMLIDHVGVLLLPELDILRTIGRISFPIFCFFIANGFRYTSDRKKYFTRILIFAFISQIPYMFLNYDAKFEPLHFNVLFLFAYSIIVLHFIDKFRDKKVLATLITIVLIAIPVILKFNIAGFMFSYNYYGILLVIIFYVFHNDNRKILISFLILSIGDSYLSALMYRAKELGFVNALVDFKGTYDFFIKYSNILLYQARSIMGVLIIFGLSKVNFSFRMNKYFFYAFYPVHISILLLIRYFMGM